MPKSILLDLQLNGVDANKENIQIATSLTRKEEYQNVVNAKEMLDSALIERGMYLTHKNSYTDRSLKNQDDRCYAILTKLVAKETEFLDQLSESMKDYGDIIKKALISMELAYQTNQIATISDQALDKIMLAAPSYNWCINHLTSLHKAISAFTDIKALQAGSISTDEISSVISLFSGEPLLQTRLSSIAKDSVSPYYRVENVRPSKRGLATQLGYNNVKVISIYKQLQFVANDLEKLYLHWFVEYPRFASSSKCRAHQAFDDLLYTKHNSVEQVDFFDSVKVRLARLEQASRLILNAFYPMVLSEITSYTQVLKSLGVYRTLTKESKNIDLPLGKEERQYNVNYDYLMFANGNRDDRKTYTYIPKALSFAHATLQTAINSLEFAASQYNNANRHVVSLQAENVPSYTAKQLISYLTEWNTLFTCVDKIVRSFLNQSKPIVSWDTFSFGTEEFVTYRTALKPILQNLDIESVDTKSSVLPTKYTSFYRENTDRCSLVTIEELGYTEQATQIDLHKQSGVCLNTLYELDQILTTTYKTLDHFAKPRQEIDSTTLSISYQTLSDLIQLTTLFQHDVEVLSVGRIC